MFSFDKVGSSLAIIIAFFLPLSSVFSDQGVIDQEAVDIEIHEENIVIKDYDQREADASAIKIIEKNTLSKKLDQLFLLEIILL